MFKKIWNFVGNFNVIGVAFAFLFSFLLFISLRSGSLLDPVGNTPTTTLEVIVICLGIFVSLFAAWFFGNRKK